jgi:hypothetical protein
MVNPLYELFAVLEKVEHADLNHPDILAAETFPSLVAALTKQVFEECRGLLPSFVLGRVLVGNGPRTLDYLRDSPFIPPPGGSLDRAIVANLLAYIRFSGVLVRHDRGGGITRKLFHQAKAPQRLIMLRLPDRKKVDAPVTNVFLNDPALPIDQEFVQAVGRLQSTVDTVDESELPRLDDAIAIDDAFGKPNISLPDQPIDLSYSLVRLWLEKSELQCYWLCGSPFRYKYPWGGIYFLSREIPENAAIVVTGLLSREIFLVAHLIEQFRAAASATEHARALALYKNAAPYVVKLLRSLNVVETTAYNLSRMLDRAPAGILRRYARPAELIPGDDCKDGEDYYGKWHFQHVWDTAPESRNSIVTQWNHFRAQVSCILLAYAGAPLPVSFNVEWEDELPWNQLGERDFSLISRLTGFNLEDLNQDRVSDPLTAHTLFVFLKNCFHKPHKAPSKARLTGSLVALWAAENDARVERAASVARSTLYGYLTPVPDVLASLEGLWQMGKDRSGECSVDLFYENGRLSVVLDGLSLETISAITALYSSEPGKSLGGREGAVQRLRDQDISLGIDVHGRKVTIVLPYVER